MAKLDTWFRIPEFNLIKGVILRARTGGVDIFFGNVTNIYDYYITNLTGKCVLRMGYLSSGKIRRRIVVERKISFLVVRKKFAQMIQLHQNKIKREIKNDYQGLIRTILDMAKSLGKDKSYFILFYFSV